MISPRRIELLIFDTKCSMLFCNKSVKQISFNHTYQTDITTTVFYLHCNTNKYLLRKISSFVRYEQAGR